MSVFCLLDLSSKYIYNFIFHFLNLLVCFCLLDLSKYERGIMKSLTIFEILLNSPYISNSIFLKCSAAVIALSTQIYDSFFLPKLYCMPCLNT